MLPGSVQRFLGISRGGGFEIDDHLFDGASESVTSSAWFGFVGLASSISNRPVALSGRIT